MTSSISSITFGRLAASAFTRDIQRAYAFYRDVLGFTKTFENGSPVGFMILEKDDAELHLSLVKDHAPSTTNVAALLVDNVDALHDVLVAAGARIIKSLADKDYGLRAFVFADLDGNRIDVGQPAEGATPAPRRFEKQNLTGAAFATCRLTGATFDDVDLSNAGFGNVNLSGARLANVNLSGVSIDNAKIDGLTIFGLDIQALARAELARRRGD
jgi:catechol 2,3-dioxygenase-like lactoylglutathione lyase family enzyme